MEENNKKYRKVAKQYPDESAVNQGKKYIGQESGNSGTVLSETYYKQKLKTLDEYLQDKYNYEIYEELTVYKPELFGLSKKELLDFFQSFYQQIYFVETNKNKPLSVAENLKRLSLTEKQSNFLCEKILNHFAGEKRTDEQLEICCREISRFKKSLNVPTKAKSGDTYDPEPYYPREKSLEEKELDDFLISKFNLKIYQNLIEGDEKDVFVEPVVFFRLFYKQLEFIEQNPSKPLMFIKDINQLPINEQQRRILFLYINELLSKVFAETSNEQIKVCQTHIETEFNKLNKKLFPEVSSQLEIVRNSDNYYHFDFELIKEHLKTLQSDNSRIGYLIEAKTDYEQRKNEVSFESVNFVGKCSLEIEKFKQLIQLEAKSEQKEIVANDAAQTNEKIGEREARQKALGLTQDRAVWAMSYFFESAETKCYNTEKAKFIAFMTGFSEEKIAQSFSRIEKIKSEMEEKTETSKKNSDDYKIIRKLFEILNLTEIQKQIDSDFGN